MNRPLSLSWIIAIALFPMVAFAYAVPANDGFVTDEAGLLSSSEQESLESRLQQYRTSTSNEIAVLTVQSLSGSDIAVFAVDVFRKWGVGGKGNNNGILLTISYDDRRINLTTGYGLEGAVPDIVARGIIERDMNPAFKDGQYFEGVSNAVDALEKHIGGEYSASRYTENVDGLSPWMFFLFFVFLNAIAAFLARSNSWWAGGIVGGVFGVILTAAYAWWVSIPVLIVIGLLFDYLVSRAGSHGRARHVGPGGWSGRGGGMGGGGFGGFGGGSTGGGGASGRW